MRIPAINYEATFVALGAWLANHGRSANPKARDAVRETLLYVQDLMHSEQTHGRSRVLLSRLKSIDAELGKITECADELVVAAKALLYGEEGGAPHGMINASAIVFEEADIAAVETLRDASDALRSAAKSLARQGQVPSPRTGDAKRAVLVRVVAILASGSLPWPAVGALIALEDDGPNVGAVARGVRYRKLYERHGGVPRRPRSSYKRGRKRPA